MNIDIWNIFKKAEKSSIKFEDFSFCFDNINSFDEIEYLFFYYGKNSEFICSITKNKTQFDIEYFDSKNKIIVCNIIKHIQQKEIQIDRILKNIQDLELKNKNLVLQYNICDKKSEFEQILNFDIFKTEFGDFIPQFLWNRKVSYLIVPLNGSKRNLYFLNKDCNNFYKYFLMCWNLLKKESVISTELISNNSVSNNTNLKNYKLYSTLIIHKNFYNIDCKILMIFH